VGEVFLGQKKAICGGKVFLGQKKAICGGKVFLGKKVLQKRPFVGKNLNIYIISFKIILGSISVGIILGSISVGIILVALEFTLL
jgi:hypothetical protein